MATTKIPFVGEGPNLFNVVMSDHGGERKSMFVRAKYYAVDPGGVLSFWVKEDLFPFLSVAQDFWCFVSTAKEEDLKNDS